MLALRSKRYICLRREEKKTLRPALRTLRMKPRKINSQESQKSQKALTARLNILKTCFGASQGKVSMPAVKLDGC